MCNWSGGKGWGLFPLSGTVSLTLPTFYSHVALSACRSSRGKCLGLRSWSQSPLDWPQDAVTILWPLPHLLPTCPRRTPTLVTAGCWLLLTLVQLIYHFFHALYLPCALALIFLVSSDTLVVLPSNYRLKEVNFKTH